METSTPAERHTSWWITSLAISVTCCAIMFVIFAGYVADIRKEIAAQDARIEELGQQESMLLSEIDTMRHASSDSISQAPADSIVIPKADAPDASMPSPGASQTGVPVPQAPAIAPLTAPSTSKP